MPNCKDKRRWPMLSIVLALFALAGPQATAGDTVDDDISEAIFDASLEELLATPMEVWSATKTKETVDSAPSIVEVVTAREMTIWGHSTIADVLQNMLGFYIIDDHILPNVSVRGVSGGLGAQSSIIKVLINGRSVSFKSTGGNWLGPELIPVSAVERIEVIRGPASALYGADAFLATVNIVLKNPEALQGGILRARVGNETDVLGTSAFSDHDQTYDVTLGGTRKDWSFLLSASRQRETRDGLRLPTSSPAPLIPHYNADSDVSSPVDHRSRVLYTELSKTTSRGFWRLSGYVSEIERSGEFSPWTQLSRGTDDQGRSVGTTVHLVHTVLGVTTQLQASDTLTFDLNLSFFTGGPGNSDRIEVASDLFFVEREFSYHGFGSTLEMTWNAQEWISIIGGIEFLFDHETLPVNKRIDKTTGEEIGRTTSLRESIDLINPAAYVQAHMKIIPEFFTLTGGLRYDHHNIYGSKITGRAGSVFLWNDYVTTKLLYGSAFKAPSPTFLYAAPIQPGDTIGNESLEPQYVHTFEFAPSFRPSERLKLYTALAYNIILDKTEFVPSGVNVEAANVARVEGLSFEIGAQMALEDLISAYVEMELQRVLRDWGQSGYSSQLMGNRNVMSPPWIVRGGFSSALPLLTHLPLRASTTVMLVGDRRASAENILENQGPYTLPMYVAWNASLMMIDMEWIDNLPLTIALRGYNLLDSKVADPGFNGIDYPRLRRRVMVEAVQTF